MIALRRVPWILNGYFMILLFSLFVLYLLPKENFLDSSLVSEKTLDQALSADLEFYSTVLTGRVEQIDGVIKSGQKDLEFDGNELKIIMAGDQVNINLMILVERKDTRDGKIEVVNYASRSILERIDFTNDIKPPEVSLAGNSLIIKPERYQVTVNKFEKDFVVAHVLGESIIQENNIIRGNVIGSQLLYLRVPKEVQIEGTGLGLGIQYVGGS